MKRESTNRREISLGVNTDCFPVTLLHLTLRPLSISNHTTSLYSPATQQLHPVQNSLLLYLSLPSEVFPSLPPITSFFGFGFGLGSTSTIVILILSATVPLFASGNTRREGNTSTRGNYKGYQPKYTQCLLPYFCIYTYLSL